MKIKSFLCLLLSGSVLCAQQVTISSITPDQYNAGLVDNSWFIDMKNGATPGADSLSIGTTLFTPSTTLNTAMRSINNPNLTIHWQPNIFQESVGLGAGDGGVTAQDITGTMSITLGVKILSFPMTLDFVPSSTVLYLKLFDDSPIVSSFTLGNIKVNGTSLGGLADNAQGSQYYAIDLGGNVLSDTTFSFLPTGTGTFPDGAYGFTLSGGNITVPVPEPSVWGFLALGTVSLVALMRRDKE